MNRERLTGRVALVTGGGRGIGKAIAKRLYEDKADLVICGTTEDVLTRAAEEIATDEREVSPMVCDVSDEVGQCGITVNAISPGLTQSETVQEHDLEQMSEELATKSAIPRLEYPEDLVGTAAWLASDDAAFVTGQTISVSGGLSLH